MPSSDYTSAVGGGLKLKGSSGGIDKKKKKKKSKPTEDKPSTASNNDANAPTTTDLQKALAEDDLDKVEISEVKEYGKTEAQRRHEERRKKRLEERLQREGVKTHKERVQELNKYLSTLSEHNDMPRIGPG